ncbi:hypothetical protein D3C72_1746070 [compost metagenome]
MFARQPLVVPRAGRVGGECQVVRLIDAGVLIGIVDIVVIVQKLRHQNNAVKIDILIF